MVQHAMHDTAYATRVSAVGAKGEAIRFTGVTKRFGTTAAVDGISLEVRTGEFLSLLGPSGSGKTTLLMMVAGFETPSSGTIHLSARDLTHVPPNKRGVGMVFQRYALFPHMNVAENVAFPLKMRRVAKPDLDRRVEAALGLVRLSGYGARKPSQLSGGQQQRVAVARALVFEPGVVLMDEPLGALDKKLREELQIEFKTLHQKLGLTILYVTHDQEEAMTMSDRIAVMNHGRIEQVGTPLEIYGSPASRFVADFIGKMNFLPATVSKVAGDRLELSVLGVSMVVPRSAWCITSAPEGPVTLAIRPQHVRIAEQGDASPACLPGMIETTVFTGTHSSLIVGLGGDTTIAVQIPAESALKRGEHILVTLDPARVQLFPGRA